MKVAIITSRYPSKNNPYNHMFVHMRSIEMIKQGIDVTIFIPSNNLGKGLQNFNSTFPAI